MGKEKEMIERNIELSTEFSKYLFEHPELEEKIPLGAEIVILPEFDTQLRDFNLKLGRELEANEGRVVYIKIARLRPKVFSRIEDVNLESAVSG
ncbi:hypothetical protein KKB54_01005 [bacterium]|nr:hypothetical protein [bacterium]MBU0899387.1 hypothetical protein [bacterium]MBU1153393.1 hypothetical protein [bacterium]MBU1782483.1 hypothetical protein [bacterium]